VTPTSSYRPQGRELNLKAGYVRLPMAAGILARLDASVKHLDETFAHPLLSLDGTPRAGRVTMQVLRCLSLNALPMSIEERRPSEEELGMNEVEDVDTARRAAEIEKPLRDAAREPFVEEDEKDILDGIAEEMAKRRLTGPNK
jgi:hypothetical protein